MTCWFKMKSTDKHCHKAALTPWIPGSPRTLEDLAEGLKAIGRVAVVSVHPPDGWLSIEAANSTYGYSR